MMSAKIGTVLLLMVLCILLSSCDDFSRNVDGVIYETECYNKTGSNYFTLVKLQEEEQGKEINDETVVIGRYGSEQFYFESSTIYNYYRVEVNGQKGTYYSILDAIEEHDYTMEFLVDWCENSVIDEDLLRSKLYKITFNTGVDIIAFQEVEILEGDTINLQAFIPVLGGYKFLGWTDQDDEELRLDSTKIVYVDDIFKPISDTRLTPIFMVDLED